MGAFFAKLGYQIGKWLFGEDENKNPPAPNPSESENVDDVAIVNRDKKGTNNDNKQV